MCRCRQPAAFSDVLHFPLPLTSRSLDERIQVSARLDDNLTPVPVDDDDVASLTSSSSPPSPTTSGRPSVRR